MSLLCKVFTFQEMATYRKRGKNWRSSAEAIAANDDILTEILLHMPVKSIIKCKRVSKHLREVINSVDFARLYARKKKMDMGNSGLFLYKHNNVRAGTKFLSLNDNPDEVEVVRRGKVPGGFPKDRISILQACNGLFLCCNRYDLWTLSAKLYVCNATIKQNAEIAHPGYKPGWYFVGIGFGFDPMISAEYRVVAIWKSVPESTSVYSVEVYEPATRVWRAARGEVLVERVGMPMFVSNGVFHKGAIYWLERDYTASKYGLDIDFAYYFDFETESLKQLELPPKSAGSRGKTTRIAYFGGSGDGIHLIEKIEGTVKHQFLVFGLKEDCSGWKAMYCIDFCDFHSVGDKPPASVVRVIRGKEEDQLTVVISIPGKILAYNAKNQTKRLLQKCTGRDFDAFLFDWCHSFEYVETLYTVSRLLPM